MGKRKTCQKSKMDKASYQQLREHLESLQTNFKACQATVDAALSQITEEAPVDVEAILGHSKRFQKLLKKSRKANRGLVHELRHSKNKGKVGSKEAKTAATEQGDSNSNKKEKKKQSSSSSSSSSSGSSSSSSSLSSSSSASTDDEDSENKLAGNINIRLERLPNNLDQLMKKYNIKAIRNTKGELISATDIENLQLKKLRKISKEKGKAQEESLTENTNIMPRSSRRTVEATVEIDESSSSSEATLVQKMKDEHISQSKKAGKKEAIKMDVVSENEDEENDSSDSEIFQIKKKVIKTKTEESPGKEGGSEEPKRKRRVKRVRDSDSADSDDDDDSDKDKSRSNKRKNIRKVMKDTELEDVTKKAAKDEQDRKKRLEERQKVYNQMYNEKLEKVKELDSLVLDFDEESKTEVLTVDPKLVKKLKPHQASGIKFMFDASFESIKRMKTETGSGCILAHCMGLGKTLQVITLIHTLLTHSERTNVHRVLIICPLSTVLNWVNEFTIWMEHVEHNADIDIYELSKFKQNNDRAKIVAQWHDGGGVMVLGYDMFRNLSNDKGTRIKKKARDQLQMGLVNPGPELVVCDEGHLLKNEKTSLSKSVNKIKTLRRVVLTGTPLQNNLKEYYCMVQFVKPNLLGKYTEYLNRFVNPITNGQYIDSTPRDIDIMKKRSHVLHKMLDGCVQRRDYGVLAPFLPPKHEYVILIKLTELQVKLYKFYMENISLRSDTTQKKTSVLFADFQNLQRIWTHPRVLRYNSDRYEIAQQKKRDNESEDSEESEGSLKDFVVEEDDDEPLMSDKSSNESVDSDGSPSKKHVPAARVTRGRAANNPDLMPASMEEYMEDHQQKSDNPTEWWMEMVPEEELDNIEISGKLQLLFSILEECESIGDKLLVFSQSLFSLDVIEHFLSLADANEQANEKNPQLAGFAGSWALGLDYFRLDGSTTIENRNLACKAFNRATNPRARLFLISTRAGGLGINLVAANRVVIFDASWNPSHDVQSIFRVYRFGQVKPCYIYRFLALGTMEEKIYERQVTKQAISKRVLDEQQIDRHYKENDLLELFNYELEPEKPKEIPIFPKDRLFAELLNKYDHIIYKYHEHDSLLENKEEETLNEEERKAAWEEFEAEKTRPVISYSYSNVGRPPNSGPVTSNNIFGFRTDILLRLLNLKARKENPAMTEYQISQVIPYLVQQLYRQMANGDLSLYNSLISIQQEFQSHPSMAHMGPFNPMGFNPYQQVQTNQNQMMYQQQQQPQPAIHKAPHPYVGVTPAQMSAAQLETARKRPMTNEVIELD